MLRKQVAHPSLTSEVIQADPYAASTILQET